MSGKHIESLPMATQSRDWKMTAEADRHSQDQLQEVLRSLHYPYWIFSEERGSGGFHHYQGFIQTGKATRLSTLIKDFKAAGYVGDKGQGEIHFQPRGRQPVSEAIAYCSKTETHIAGPWSEGVPELHNKQGKRSDLEVLREAVDSGKTLAELMTDSETMYMMSGSKVLWVKNYIHAKAERKALEERRNHRWPKVHGIYIWGDSGVGKTTWVMDHFDDLYPVSGHDHPFDGYEGQDVVLIDEFHLGGALDVDSILRICDRWRIGVDARYTDVTPSWSTVIMTSNLSPKAQFDRVPDDQKPALSRRISEWHFTEADREAEVGHLDGLDPLSITIGDDR